ncbi:HNH endonuclease [Micromonospora sp. WMMD1102]|uniref:HNH endonuclease n=1 Tax=Micromonospora sp. WMMD1102 TaxID=3016105 RepID=UPI00241555B0|nr:HNH endonuclease [Micromonospora sp. WMMD1102]MDG4784341.1 HNH endonuclease [Micromonospora sp. WMMD1102]MDG4784414.1 HNH endonuclease [Micromonospora sp. WMMD1102]
MSEAWRALGGRRRTLARQVYARDRATPGYLCHCGRPIDWTLAWPDPMSKSVDHVHETQDGGALTSLDNLATAHLGCNSSKGAQRRREREREQRAAQAVVIAIDPRTI